MNESPESDEPRTPPSWHGTESLRRLLERRRGPTSPSSGLAGQTRALADLAEANRERLAGLEGGSDELRRRVDEAPESPEDVTP